MGEPEGAAKDGLSNITARIKTSHVTEHGMYVRRDRHYYVIISSIVLICV